MRQLTEASKKFMPEINTQSHISDEALLHVPDKVMEYGHRKPYAEPLDCPHLSLRKKDKHE